MSRRGDLHRLLGNAALVIGLAGIVALLAMGVFGAALAPDDPNAQHLSFPKDDPVTGFKLLFPPTTPDADHLLGTDQLGRDQWSRILAGARLTLSAVLAAATARLGIGILLGLTSGWYGGAFDRVVRSLAAGAAAIPQLLLAILLVLVTRTLGLAGFIAALALVGWPDIVEFVRSETRRAKAAPFMEAARGLGAPTRSLIRRHIVSALAPQLLTIAALETGGVLLLLAELGLIGLFLAGATYYIGDNGQPVLPLRDRAPEWGQMLGGIQFYAAQEQLVVLIPAIFVVLAAVTFGLLADGLRAASDPFSPRLLLPGTFGRLSKVLAATLCISAVGFVGLNVTPSAMTMEEGRVLAARTAEQTWPGSVYVASVARYSSAAHGMERPEKLTYYYRNDHNEVLRISYQNADRLAVEVRLYESEDEIDVTTLKPLPAGLGSYDGPIAKAETIGGASFRVGTPNYLVRAMLTWPSDREAPVYVVAYGTLNRGQFTIRRFCCYDGATAEPVDSILLPRLDAPYPVPADCPVTRVVVQAPEPRFSAYYASGPTLSVGSIYNLYFEGDNPIQVLGGVGIPRLTNAANLTGTGSGASLLNASPLGGAGGSGVGFATLRLIGAGCWRLRIAAGDTASLEFVIYAYPWGCRPPQLQRGITPLQGVVAGVCGPPR